MQRTGSATPDSANGVRGQSQLCEDDRNGTRAPPENGTVPVNRLMSFVAALLIALAAWVLLFAVTVLYRLRTDFY